MSVGLLGLSANSSTQAASAGVNDTMNFQGRLLSNTGAVVSDGDYNIEFKIYAGGDGTVAGDTSPTSSPGTLLWTEDWVYGTGSPDHRVVVKNGYFSVQLGSITPLPSSVNLDNPIMWLSMNVENAAGATLQCSGFASGSPAGCSGGDGEMLPMRSMSSAPFALNADNANQVNSNGYNNNFLDLAVPGAPTVATTTGSLTGTFYYVVTATNAAGETLASSCSASVSPAGQGVKVSWTQVNGATGYKIYRNTSCAFTSGSLLDATVSGGQTTSVTDNLATTTAGLPPTTVTGTTMTLQAWNSQTNNLLNLQNSSGANLASIDASGNLIFGAVSGTSGTTTVSVATAGAGSGGNNLMIQAATGGSGTGAAGGTLTLQGGAGGGTNGGGGGVTIDAGKATGSGADGTISIGANVGSTITIGKNGETGTLSLKYGGGTLNVGLDSSRNNTLNLESTAGNGFTDTLNIGNSTTTGSTSNVTIGSLAGSSSTSIQGGTGNINLDTNQAGYGTAVQSVTNNSTKAFQVQNAASTPIFGIGTVSTSNLITNPSFETNTTGWSNKGTGSISRITTQQFSGSASMQVAMTAANDGALYDITLTNSTTYSMSFFAKNSSGTASFLSFGYSSDGSTDTDCGTGQKIVGGGWTNYSCTFTTPATNSGTPYIYIKQNSAASRTIYVDAVQLIQASNVGLYGEGILTTSAVDTTPLDIQPANDSTGALQVFSSVGYSVLTVDSLDRSVGIGATVKPGANLQVNTTAGGTIGEIIQGTGSQTANLFQAETSTGANLFSISAAGVVTVAGGNTPDLTTPAAGTANSLTVQPGTSSTASTTGAALDLYGGNSSGTTSFGGDVNIDAGTGTSVNGSIYIGQANADSTQIGPSTGGGYAQIGNTGVNLVTDNSSYGVVAQSALNISNAFQVQNNNGYAILSGDTVGNQLVLGDFGVLNGKLDFQNSSNVNDISLTTGAASSSYSLTLPTTAPTPNQCLLSGAVTAGLLTFGSCGAETLQQAYNQSAGASPSIDVTLGNKGVTIQNDNTSPITGELFGVHDKTASGLGSGLFTVANTGATTIRTGDSTNNYNTTTAFSVQNAAASSILGVDTSTTVNLLPETASNFETGQAWTAKGTGATLTQDTAQAYMGSDALKIATSTTANAGGQYSYSMAASTTYTLSMYVKGNTSFSTIAIGHQDVSGTDTDCLTGQAIYSNDWVRLSCSFTTAASVSGPNIYIKDTGTSHAFWIDGVQLETGSTATVYNPGGQLQLNGVISGPVALKNTSDSQTAFQIQNASGANILNVDTRNKQVIVGATSGYGKLEVESGSTGSNQAEAAFRGVASALDSTDGGSQYLNIMTLSNDNVGLTGGLADGDTFEVSNRGYITIQGYSLPAGAGAGANAGTSFSVTGATGQAGATGNYAGGAGGSLTLAGGTGGASTGTAANANGGSVTISGGAAGTGGSGTAGVSGAVTLQSGVASESIQNSGVTISTSTNSTTALQVQNSGGSTMVGVDNTQGGSGLTATTPVVSGVTAAGSPVESYALSGTSVTVSPHADGNLMIVEVEYPSFGTYVNNLSSTDVYNWHMVSQHDDSTNNAHLEIWEGIVGNTTASQAINVTFAGGTPPYYTDIVAQEFTDGLGTNTIWNVTSYGAQYNATTAAYPSLTAGSSGQLYWGYAWCSSTCSAGSTTGFTYSALAGEGSEVAYDTNLTGGNNYSPTATIASSSTDTQALIVGASVGAAATIQGSQNIKVDSASAVKIQDAASDNVFTFDTFQRRLTINTSDNGVILNDVNGAGENGIVFEKSGSIEGEIGLSDAAGRIINQTAAGDLAIKSSNGAIWFSANDSSVATEEIDTSGNLIVGGGESSGVAAKLLELDTSNTAPTEVDGGIYYDSSNHSFQCGVSTAWQACTGMMYSQSSVVNYVNGQPNETALGSTWTIPYNDCQPGVVYSLTSEGFYQISTAANLKFFVTDNGTNEVQGVNSTMATTGTGAYDSYDLYITITCHTTSQVSINGFVTIQNNGTYYFDEHASYVGISNSSGGDSWGISIQWGSALGGSNLGVTQEQEFFQRLGP